MRTLSILLCSFLFAPVLASAHGDGLSFERKVGNILIDIGYGNTQPSKGTTLTYSFDLFDNTNVNAPVFEPFTQVDGRLFRGRDLILNKTLPNDGVNIPSLSYQFQDAGNYTLAVSYARKAKEPIGATFGFAVLQNPVASSAASVSSSPTASSVSAALTAGGSMLPVNPMAAASIAVAVIALLVLVRVMLHFKKKGSR